MKITRRYIGFGILLFLLTSIIFIAGELYIQTLNKLLVSEKKILSAKERIKELTEQNKITSSQSTLPPKEQPGVFSSLSSKTSDELFEFSPFPMETYQQVRELSSGKIIAVLDNSINGPVSVRSVWVLEPASGAVQLIAEPLRIGSGNNIFLGEWSNGVLVDAQFSPGEAVGDLHRKFLNSSGNVIAETKNGTWNQDSKTLIARIGTKEINARIIVQKGKCLSEQSDQTPRTILTSIVVNGRTFPLPTAIAVECEFLYGGGFDDPVFPTPLFDGKNLTFHLPGYDVSLTPAGTAIYRAKISYLIPCKLEGDAALPLIREDRSGSHQVMENVLTDSFLRDFNSGKYCFNAQSFDGKIANFRIKKFDRKEYDAKGENFLKTIGSIDYNSITGEFENLTINKNSDD
ncbi:hypothetical protein EPN90_02790 [Patescibacteria group bacterium]|nr:MAG: hypothetical protein EPN90_02790 [Patescibacteria group bacterium]